MTVDHPALATAADLARLLGVDRTTVYGWIERYEDFPVPAQETSAGRLWEVEGVKRWVEGARERLRPGRRRQS